jgi:hypothetical protein
LKLKLKSSPTKLQKCDINGYKALRKPLLIKFNETLNRWMFSTEIEQRTITTLMCASASCGEKYPMLCGKGVWRELIALDDGFSWVVVGEKKCGKTVTGKRGSAILYCVDEKTQCMRRQDRLESELSKAALEMAKETPRNVFCDEEADYVSLFPSASNLLSQIKVPSFLFILLDHSGAEMLTLYPADAGFEILGIGM